MTFSVMHAKAKGIVIPIPNNLYRLPQPSHNSDENPDSQPGHIHFDILIYLPSLLIQQTHIRSCVCIHLIRATQLNGHNRPS